MLLQAVQHICGDLYEVVDYPARGFAFQLYGSTVNSMARCLKRLTAYMRRTAIHNFTMMSVFSYTYNFR